MLQNTKKDIHSLAKGKKGAAASSKDVKIKQEFPADDEDESVVSATNVNFNSNDVTPKGILIR